MDFLSSGMVWAAIGGSAVAVWIVSALCWMIIGHHKNDHKGLPDENGFMAFVRGMNLRPGAYGFPHFDSQKECHSPEAVKKWKEGPAGFMTIMNPNFSMGANMLKTFLVYLVTSFFIAYLASMAFPVVSTPDGVKALSTGGSMFAKYFQFFATAGVLAYCFAPLPNAIWFGTTRAAVMCFIDGVVYGLVTGAVFATFWPR